MAELSFGKLQVGGLPDHVHVGWVVIIKIATQSEGTYIIINLLTPIISHLYLGALTRVVRQHLPAFSLPFLSDLVNNYIYY